MKKVMLALLLAADVCAAGCTRSPEAAGVPPRAIGARHPYTIPHVLRFSSAEDIAGLNPHLLQQTVAFSLASMTMAWLIRTGPDARPIPELATVVPTLANGGIAPDGKAITYHLRHDARWSDGVPFTADDVVFSIKTILNPQTNEVSRDGWDLITKIDERDKYTVTLHLKKPYAPYAVSFFASGTNPCVLPMHLLARLPTINHAAYNELPVGIGPFKYARWKRGDAVEMVANPLYFRGRPKLDRVVYKVIPDRNTVLTQLATHEIDLWLPVGAGFYPRAEAIAGVATQVQPAYAFDHLDFNLTHAAVADVVVRRAMRLAMDREQLRTAVRHGLGPLSEGPFGPNHVAYHPIPLIPFDLARANALLDAGGWRRDRDGVRAKNGVRLALDFAAFAGSADVDATVELLRQNWKKIGVEITVHHYPASVLLAPDASGVLGGGKFDLVYLAWNTDALGDLHGTYGCGEAPPVGQNDARWCNARADAAMLAFNGTYDERKRSAYDAIAIQEMINDVPTVVLNIRNTISAYNSDLHNWHPNAEAPFDAMMDVDI